MSVILERVGNSLEREKRERSRESVEMQLLQIHQDWKRGQVHHVPLPYRGRTTVS